MVPYILRRLLIAIPVLLGVTVVTFTFVNLAPGDPVTALLNPEQMASLGPGWVQQQKEALGLNRPLPVRYALWLRELARQPRVLLRRPPAGADEAGRAHRPHLTAHGRGVPDRRRRQRAARHPGGGPALLVRRLSLERARHDGDLDPRLLRRAGRD